MPNLFLWGHERASELRVPGYDTAAKPRPILPKGPAVFIAFSEKDLDAYSKWFRSLGVRVRAQLRRAPLEPGSALYLPVTYDSWAVLAAGVEGLGAALQAARLLSPGATVVCPCHGLDEALVAQSQEESYTRVRDRIHPLKASQATPADDADA